MDNDILEEFLDPEDCEDDEDEESYDNNWYY